MTKSNIISIVIPVFNEENFILKVLERVEKSDTLGMGKEIIVIDDASTDKSLAILNKNQKRFGLKIISNKVNTGKGAALKKGLHASTGQIVLIQDADLEYDPADYPKLLQPFIDYGADAVFGSRLVSAAPHRVLYFWHYVVNVGLTTLSNVLTNLNLTDMETGYKVFRGEIIRDIATKLKSKRFGFEPEVTARLSKIKSVKIFEVGISYSGRSYDEGKKIGWRDGIKALLEIIYYNFGNS